MSSLTERRLEAHRLVGPPFRSPVAAIRAFGAVQAQDYPAAKWAIGQRTDGATDAELDRLFDAGAILRTHVMRPTWHFVLPEDAGWLMDCTGPRLWGRLQPRWRQLGLDARTVSRAISVFERSVREEGPLTRAQLAERLDRTGISPLGQRLPHLLSAAELKSVLISGPRRGRDFTFARFADRARRPSIPGRADQLGELAVRYFQSHGPAQLADFVWWSGLSTSDARLAIEAAGHALERTEILERTYWASGAASDPGRAGRSARRTIAHLLPNFDEYTVGYRDRSAIVPERPADPGLFSYGSILSNVLLIRGRVRGGWRRRADRRGTALSIRTTERLTRAERAATEDAAARYGRFVAREVDITFLD